MHYLRLTHRSLKWQSYGSSHHAESWHAGHVNLHHIVISYIIKLIWALLYHIICTCKPSCKTKLDASNRFMQISFYVASKVSKQTEATYVHHQVWLFRSLDQYLGVYETRDNKISSPILNFVIRMTPVQIISALPFRLRNFIVLFNYGGIQRTFSTSLINQDRGLPELCEIPTCRFKIRNTQILGK